MCWLSYIMIHPACFHSFWLDGYLVICLFLVFFWTQCLTIFCLNFCYNVCFACFIYVKLQFGEALTMCYAYLPFSFSSFSSLIYCVFLLMWFLGDRAYHWLMQMQICNIWFSMNFIKMIKITNNVYSSKKDCMIIFNYSIWMQLVLGSLSSFSSIFLPSCSSVLMLW